MHRKIKGTQSLNCKKYKYVKRKIYNTIAWWFYLKNTSHWILWKHEYVKRLGFFFWKSEFLDYVNTHSFHSPLILWYLFLLEDSLISIFLTGNILVCNTRKYKRNRSWLKHVLNTTHGDYVNELRVSIIFVFYLLYEIYNVFVMIFMNLIM